MNCRSIEVILTNEAIRPQILKIVNKRDHFENTALHYATQMWPQSVVRQLLEAGANIGMKNHWHETPVAKILPATLEAYLDEVSDLLCIYCVLSWKNSPYFFRCACNQRERSTMTTLKSLLTIHSWHHQLRNCLDMHSTTWQTMKDQEKM